MNYCIKITYTFNTFFFYSTLGVKRKSRSPTLTHCLSFVFLSLSYIYACVDWVEIETQPAKSSLQ